MNKSKVAMEKTAIGLLLIGLLCGCGQGVENTENEQSVETNNQADEAAQTEEEIMDDSIAFADTTMKEKIIKACEGSRMKSIWKQLLFCTFLLQKMKNRLLF